MEVSDSDDDDLDRIAPEGHRARRTRRETNVFNRAWNSLRPREIAHMNANLQTAEILLMMMWIMLYNLNIYLTCEWLPAEFFVGYLQSIRLLQSYFHLLMLDFMDYAFYPTSNHDHAADRFRPKQHRTIDSFADDYQAEAMTRFNKESLRRLMHFLRIPQEFRPPERRTIFTGEECLLVLLHQMCKGLSFMDMSHFFGGDPRVYTYMIRCVVDHLYTTFYHKISGDSMRMWTDPETINTFRHAIWSKLKQSDQYNQDSPVHLFRIFGFVDGFGQETQRVGGAAQTVYNFVHDVQRAFYSGYFKGHGLKSLVVFLPNGMIGSVYIASLAHNDRGLVNLSGLGDYLVELLGGQRIGNPNNWKLPCLYGDSIFQSLECILPRYNRTMLRHLNDIYYEQLNERMSRLRIAIEHAFGLYLNLFKYFHHAYMIRMFPDASPVQRKVLVSFLILNCYSCEYGSLSGHFDLLPPSLSVYLPVDEMLDPAPVVDDEQLGTVFNFGR